MKYCSLFSGIGGLEHPTILPEFFCDKDEAARRVLGAAFQNVPIYADIATLKPVEVDCVAGGWPCQDLSVAGTTLGIRGERSGLFFDMVEFAKRCRANTIVGENVPNLLKLRGGMDFRLVLATLVRSGFRWVAWRTLDAREFGLPQSRRRVVIVASAREEAALALHRRITRGDLFRPPKGAHFQDHGKAYGFYWTGGLSRSLCIAEGVVPPLKVGSSTSKGTSPVAVFSEGAVRKLSASAGLSLQGFRPIAAFDGHIEGDVFRMAGNAVPRPLGRFALQCATWERRETVGSHETTGIPPSGVFIRGVVRRVEHDVRYSFGPLAGFLDDHCRELSPQASAGLLTRVIRSQRRIPVAMFDALYSRSRTRTSLIGTRVNSFDILDSQLDACGYRSWLVRSTDESGLSE